MENELKKLTDAIQDIQKTVDGALADQKTSVEEQIAAVTKKNAEIALQINEIASKGDNLENQIKEVARDASVIKSGTAVSLPGVSDEKKKFSFHKAFSGIATGCWKNAGFEQEVFEQTQKRAMGTNPATAGGYIVPIEIANELIELLRPQSVVNTMGATVLTGLNSIIQLPKQTGGATAYWIVENVDEITESELTFGQLTMRPRAVACLTTFSKSLMHLTEETNNSIEQLVRRDFALALALEIDRAALLGTGVNGQPTGIANTPSVNSYAHGTDGGFWNFESAKEMEGKLEDDNALRGSLGYVMNGKVIRKLEKYRVPQYSGDTEGLYLMLPMSDELLRKNIGYNFAKTTQIPTNISKGSGTNLSTVFFANWQELILGFWGGLALDASIHAGDSFKKNQVQLRAVMEVDVAVRHPESFCVCADAQTV